MEVSPDLPINHRIFLARLGTFRIPSIFPRNDESFSQHGCNVINRMGTSEAQPRISKLMNRKGTVCPSRTLLYYAIWKKKIACEFGYYQSEVLLLRLVSGMSNDVDG